MMLLGPLFLQKVLMETSDDVPVLPEWLQEHAIDLEEALKEILEQRNSE